MLYECLTAQRAIAGDTLTDVLASVIERAANAQDDFSAGRFIMLASFGQRGLDRTGLRKPAEDICAVFGWPSSMSC